MLCKHCKEKPVHILLFKDDNGKWCGVEYKGQRVQKGAKAYCLECSIKFRDKYKAWNSKSQKVNAEQKLEMEKANEKG